MPQKGADIMLKRYYGFDTVNGTNRLPKEIRRVLKEIYLDEHPYRAYAVTPLPLWECPHTICKSEDYIVEFGFASFEGMSDEEIQEEFEANWMHHIYSDYDCTGRLFTWAFHWKRNPNMGEGVVSYVHKMSVDI